MLYTILANILNLAALVLCIGLAIFFTERTFFNKYFNLLLIDVAFITILVAFKQSESFDFYKRTPAYQYAATFLLVSVLPLLYVSILKMKRDSFRYSDLLVLPSFLFLLVPLITGYFGIRVPDLIYTIDSRLNTRVFYLLWVNISEVSLILFGLCLAVFSVVELSGKCENTQRKRCFEFSLLRYFSLYVLVFFPALVVFRLTNPLFSMRLFSVITTALVVFPLAALALCIPLLLRNAAVKYRKSALTNSEAAQIVEKARTLICGEKLWRDSTLNQPQLAQMLEVSVNKLSQAINTELGQNFNTMINEYRIAEAKQLLVQNDMKVIEIAHNTGFETLSRFYTLFKKICGMTPTDYRRQFGTGTHEQP